MNKEEMRKAFEAYQIAAIGDRSEYMLRKLPIGDYCSVRIQAEWQVWQARQPEIDQLKEEIEHYRKQLDLTCEEGLTPADAKKLRQCNHNLAAENERLLETLRQAKKLAGGSERDNAHDMDSQLCDIWYLCDKAINNER